MSTNDTSDEAISSNSAENRSPDDSRGLRWILRILSARYGPCESTTDGEIKRETLYRDVSRHIRALLQVSLAQRRHEATLWIPALTPQGRPRIQIPILPTHQQLSMNAIFGDPAPGLSKRLIIRYTLTTGEDEASFPLQVSFPEHESLVVLNTKLPRSSIVLQDLSSARPLASSWKLPATVSEVVLPLLLPFLSIRERVQAQRICRLWQGTIQRWGIATTIDATAQQARVTVVRGLLTHSHSSLVNLFLSGLENLQPQDLHPSLPHLKKLRSLDISRCVQLGDETLRLIARHNRATLEVLYVKGLPLVTDEGLEAICETCWNMKALDISQLHQITDQGCAAVGDRLTQLQALFLRDNYLVTNESVDVILNQCRFMEQLTLWGCYRLNKLALTTPANPKLVMLNLWGCFGLGEDAAHSISLLHSLQSLTLSECHRLSDGFVETMIQGLPKLKHLQLRYCRNLADASVEAIAHHLGHLSSLDLSFCTNITARAVALLMERRGRYQLSELRLEACRGLDLINDRTATTFGESERIILASLQSLLPHLSLCLLDLRGCGISSSALDDPIYDSHLFTEGLRTAGFTQRSPGFFTRGSRWDEDQEDRLVAEFRDVRPSVLN